MIFLVIVASSLHIGTRRRDLLSIFYMSHIASFVELWTWMRRTVP